MSLFVPKRDSDLIFFHFIAVHFIAWVELTRRDFCWSLFFLSPQNNNMLTRCGSQLPPPPKKVPSGTRRSLLACFVTKKKRTFFFIGGWLGLCWKSGWGGNGIITKRGAGGGVVGVAVVVVVVVVVLVGPVEVNLKEKQKFRH